MSVTTRFGPAVKAILADASLAYRGRDDERFRMLLRQALEHAPERLDLWLCLANHFIQTDRPDDALEIFNSLFHRIPSDVDTLFLLAHWRRYAGDADGAAEAMRRLTCLSPGRAAELAAIWVSLDAWFARPVSDAIPTLPPEVQHPAILVLGYKLDADGEPQPPLVARLEKTLQALKHYPGATVVASGGVPRNGRVEAVVMRKWLKERGIDARRICEEGYSRDTVENLLFSRQIMQFLKIDAVVVVTAAGNVRRVGPSMEMIRSRLGPPWHIEVVAASGPTFDAFRDQGEDRLKAYRDVLRAAGMPMMAVYPELAER